VRTYSPDDIVQIIVRRRWLILVPFALGLAATPFLARFAVEKYRSETLIMVVPQRVPDSYVKATVTAKIEDRLPSISEQILSRSRLEKIITDMDLYKGQRGSQVMEDVVQTMRGDVSVTLVGASENSDSFRVSYVSDNPETARKVTERLASLYIEQNLRDRENQAESTSQFISTQLQDAKQRLVEQEKKLEEYRKRHSGELPTQLQGNLQSIQNTNLQLQALNESMNRGMERRLLIERQIADTESMPLPQSAASQASPITPSSSTSQRLDAARARLAALLQYYTPDHPEVITVQRQVAELQARLEGESPLGATDVVVERELSPLESAQRKRLMDLKSELLVVDRQLESNRAEEMRLKGAIGALQSKVDVLPSRESELVELTRDYSTLQAAYGSLLMKREDSMIAANLERRQIGEQFRILDAASMPERPYNQRERLGIMLSGALVGLLLGLLAVVALEFSDSSFHHEDDVTTALSLPVLALIPVMSSEREITVSRRRERLKDLAGVMVLCAVFTELVLWRLRS
jgi:polysaccharide chain length determinant protein (PEP-CTERM system associated)